MATIPLAVQELLDGNDLAQKIGVTALVIATDTDGWPRVATVSVGEILASASDELLLTLYSRSRTTGAVVATGNALIVLVWDGAILKIALKTETVADDMARANGRTVLRGAVHDVVRDEVPYARVTNGIEFELVDDSTALERWSEQLAGLRLVAAAR